MAVSNGLRPEHGYIHRVPTRMTSTGLATPPRKVRRTSSPSGPPPVATHRPASREYRSYERVLYWSLVASLLLHGLVLLLSPLFIQTEFPPGGQVAPLANRPENFGLQVIEVVPSESAAEPDEVEDPPVESVPETPPAVSRPTGETPSEAVPPAEVPAEPGDAPTSAADALRPGYRDPRLYVPSNPYVIDQRSDHDRFLERFRARLDAVNDSMGYAAARERETADWTTTDSEGRRWGLSEDGLHLGGITIPRALLPLPGATGDNASIERERESRRQREEIIRQEAERERREILDERRREQESGGPGNP